MEPVDEVAAKPPRIVECPQCGNAVAASDDWCWTCGEYLPPTFAEAQR